MALSVATNVNLDALRNLDAGKKYFLSTTTGEVKAASIWMRMKCAIGVKSAQQKVANLVDAVRSTLLDAAGATRDERLDADIDGLSLTEMVKGRDIVDIASRFSRANAEKIVRRQAEVALKEAAKVLAGNVLERHPGSARALDLATIAQHALKPALLEELPVKGEGGAKRLDRKAFFRILAQQRKAAVEGLLEGLLASDRLAGGKLDPYYARHVVETLFNADGTANGKTVADLKTLSQVHVDTAFKIGKGFQDNRGEIVHGCLLKKGIDPEAKLNEILGYCNGDAELETYVIDIAPALCLTSNNDVRSARSIQAKIAAIKDSLDEIKALQKTYPGTTKRMKFAMSLLGATAFPKGTLTAMARAVESCSFTRLGALTCRSSLSEIYKAMDELRKAMDAMEAQVDIDKVFENIGEDAGGPHNIAAKNITMAIILAKLGPGVAARLPHIVSTTRFKEMQYVVDELKRQFQAKDPNVILGDAAARKTAGVMVRSLDIAMSTLFDGLNARLEKPLDTTYDVVVDINSEEAMDIRFYLGDEARAQPLPAVAAGGFAPIMDD